ncbi:acylphosphatase [Endozoicomonadaceae bacterium StTr2]
MAVVSKCVRVEGKVQGVWFRASTKEQADRLGIIGWAKNLPDGAVEVLMQGSEENIERLTVWLQKGPPAASVISVNLIANTESASDCQGFQIL